MSPAQRKRNAARVLRAAELFLQRVPGCQVTCGALRQARVPAEYRIAYWYTLFCEAPAMPPAWSVGERLRDAGYPDGGAGEILEVRLMMLAWLHEMFRSGDFEQTVTFDRTGGRVP